MTNTHASVLPHPEAVRGMNPGNAGDLIRDREHMIESLIPSHVPVPIDLASIEWRIARLHFDQRRPLCLAIADTDESVGTYGRPPRGRTAPRYRPPLQPYLPWTLLAARASLSTGRGPRSALRAMLRLRVVPPLCGSRSRPQGSGVPVQLVRSVSSLASLTPTTILRTTAAEPHVSGAITGVRRFSSGGTP